MQSIILLHGALGAAAQFDQVIEPLSTDFDVHVFDLIGHGNRKNSTPFAIDTFSNDLNEYIESNNISEPIVFGYSMGGYVAMHLASKNPSAIKKIITYGTKVKWDEAIATQETRLLNPDKIEEKVPKFAQYLGSLHGDKDWKIVMQKTAQLMIELGRNNLIESFCHTINTEVEIGISNTDEMVTLEESKHIAEKLPNGRLKIHDQLPHPIQKIKSVELIKIIKAGINSIQT